MTFPCRLLRTTLAWLLLATAAAMSQTAFLDLPEGTPPAQPRPILVVFVHGVTGGTETWEGPSGRSWPRIVAEDPVFENADILVYEYPSPALWSSYSVGGLADRLAIDLRNHAIGVSNYSQVVFVAHSLGGVVVRQMLLDATDDMRNRVAGLFLFGSPMGGSIYANWASFFSSNRQIIQLERSADPDRITNRLVKDWINRGLTLKSFCAYELARPIVVERSSVQPLCNSSLRELNVGHFDLVKPANGHSDQHRLLQDWYTTLLNEQTHFTLEEEEHARILVTSCSGDRDYTEDISRTVMRALDGLSGERARVSSTLPPDWTSPWYKSLLWKETPPKVIVSHFSCFERGNRRGDTVPDRDRDFGMFLDSLKNDPVKLVVYSRTFSTNRDYLDAILRDWGFAEAYSGRIEVLPINQNALLGVNSAPMRELREAVLRALR